MKFKRYLFDEISWNSRLVGISGFRGTGKTIILLQSINDGLKAGETLSSYLYLLADQTMVVSDGLEVVASEFFRYGGKTLLIDEIHRYPQWSLILKNLYDTYPDKKIIFSGSSSLSLAQEGADLSRRALLYKLKPCSFREFLSLKYNRIFESYTWNDIRENHVDISHQLTKDYTILKEFEEYLASGCLPISREDQRQEIYWLRMNRLIDQVIYEDIGSESYPFSSNQILLKHILGIIASSDPFVLNTEKLAQTLKISKNTLYRLLDILELSELIKVVYPKQEGYRKYRKSSKILLHFPNLYATLLPTTIVSPSYLGCIRESFFVSQIIDRYPIFLSSPMDFQVEINQQLVYFEIGGPNKKFNQVKDVENGYLLMDGIESGYKNTIPLYLMGFLY
jgi:predicted AAA+ superfamily ATPase